MVSCVSTRTMKCLIKFVLITKQGSVVQRPNNPNGVNGDHGVNVQRLVEEVNYRHNPFIIISTWDWFHYMYLGVQSAVRSCNEVGKTTCFGNWKDEVDGVDRYERFKRKEQRCNPQQCESKSWTCSEFYLHYIMTWIFHHQLTANTYHGLVGQIVL